MIITNIFGNEPFKRASSTSKFCGICQEAMQKEKGDDVKSVHCAECVSTDKISQAAFWKSKIALQKVNSLSPNMRSLAEKLAENRDLINGSVGLKRLSIKSSPSQTLSEVKAAQSKEVSLDVVRNQVAELLPPILNEYGWLGKINADLYLDAIVPSKIASPIMDSINGRSALRTIVAETIGYFDSRKIVAQEAPFRAHNAAPNPGNVNSILHEGFQRISNKTGAGTRSRTIKANNFDPMEGPEDTGYAPPEDDDSTDNESKVVHLPDEQAMNIIHDKANPEMPEEANQQSDMAQDQKSPPPDMLNEGINGNSAGENMVPSSEEMEQMPQEGIKRVQSSSSDLIARRLSKGNAKPKFDDSQYFSFAGKINNTPVQVVKLGKEQKYVIDNSEPLTAYTAAFNDGSKKTFKCYATDKGALFTSDSNSYAIHAENTEKFAEFIEIDPSFVKWAFLPQHVDVKEDILSPSQDNISLPNQHMEGSPSFNDIKETHLNSSPDNSVPGGMAADEDALFNNGDPGTGGPTLAGNDEQDGENELLDTATGLMPQIEDMFPNESPESHQEMAIEAALNILEAKYKVG